MGSRPKSSMKHSGVSIRRNSSGTKIECLFHHPISFVHQSRLVFPCQYWFKRSTLRHLGPTSPYVSKANIHSSAVGPSISRWTVGNAIALEVAAKLVIGVEHLFHSW